MCLIIASYSYNICGFRSSNNIESSAFPVLFDGSPFPMFWVGLTFLSSWFIYKLFVCFTNLFSFTNQSHGVEKRWSYHTKTLGFRMVPTFKDGIRKLEALSDSDFANDKTQGTVSMDT